MRKPCCSFSRSWLVWLVLLLPGLGGGGPARCSAQTPSGSSLAFRATEGGEFVFDTGVLRGKLRPKGKTLGLAAVVHIPTGQMLDKGENGYGLFSHYRVFTTNHRYGVGAWDWPSTARLETNGAVEVLWPAAEGRPFVLRARYRWARPDQLELETIVEAQQALPGFESFLASYFNETFTNAVVCAKPAPGSLAGGLQPIESSFGDWQMFPREAKVLDLIQDGRWQLLPNPVAWKTSRQLATPVVARRAPSSNLSVVLSASSRDCFAIAAPHQTEGHYSLYLSLFGRDLKAGETARARAWLEVGTGLSDEHILKAGQAAETAPRRVTFRETDTLFANPGTGWMSGSRPPGAAPRFPYSVAYVRFNWMDAEPTEGQYNWRVLDDAINAWQPRGGTISFRVMTCNAHSRGYYTSPKWLFDAGCKSYDYLVGGDDPTSGGQRIPRIEPDYSDPVYLAKHGAFIRALGERYDGHPGLEFLDIGSYGTWGEWHTKHPAPVEVRKKIVDLYLAAFHKTPLVFMSDDAEVLAYALAHRAGFRRDGVGSPWHEQNWIGSKKYAAVKGMAETWQKAPVVFEWFGDYNYMQTKQWSVEAAVEFMLKNHVTLINDNFGRFPASAQPLLDKLTRQAGYRFVLREVVHEPTVTPGGLLTLRMQWANVGVGKLYHPYALRVALRDQNGHELSATNTPAIIQDWLPGDHALNQALFLPTTLPAGTCRVGLALVDVQGLRRSLRLAIDAPEKDGEYEVSSVEVGAAAKP